MGKPAKLEREYYPIILKYLANERHCLTASYNYQGEKAPFTERGQGQLIIDVYGLFGGIDHRTRRIEGYAVEVKRSTQRQSLGYIHQAARYSVLAHRCYLAQPSEFSDKTKIGAARVGIGLLQIIGNSVQLVAESRHFEPDPMAFALLLNRSLRISQCAVCGCYRRRHGAETDQNDTGGGHWRRDDITRQGRKYNKLVYLCPECERHWAGAVEVKRLTQKVNKLERKLEKLALAYAKLKRSL
jgi:hypothetical protein